MKLPKLFPRIVAVVVALLVLSQAPARSESSAAALPAPVTAWTPEGTATFVQPNDPSLSATVGSVAPKVNRPDPAFLKKLLELSDSSLTALSEKSSETDTQYYEGGEWQFKPRVLVCSTGPASLAAMLWKWREAHPEGLDAAAKARQVWLHKVAVDTYDTVINKYQQQNGRITDAGSHECFFYAEFANTYLVLKDSLDEPTRQRWLNAMKQQVRAMQEIGQIPDPALNGWKAGGWYVNGNVDICEAAWIYFVWQATGEQVYKELFELDWEHVLSPNQQRWKGYGLYFLKVPQKADGSDGAGYITEAQGAPGFDRNYGLLQLSIAAKLYIKSHDPRVLRVANLLCNSLLPHVDRDTMVLNCLYGSRHSDFMPFATSGGPVLAWLGGRADLLPLLPGQIDKAAVQVYLDNATKNQNNPYAYRGYGFDLATMLEAAALAEK